VTFGKELLLAPETRLPGGKELFVHLAVISFAKEFVQR
jgi:hypothetical protein